MSEPWVSVGEVASSLGVAKDSVYRWIETKGLPAHRVGRLWKFRQSEINEWVLAGRSVARRPESYQELLAIMRGRRSVRSFLPRPVPEEAVAAMLEAARWAPSAGNRQAYRFILVSSEERIEEMVRAVHSACAALRERTRPDMAKDVGAYLDHFTHFSSAPLVVAAIFRGGPDLLGGAAPGGDDGGREADSRRSLLDATSSVAAAIEHLLLAAHALGLGACWMTGPLVASSELVRLLAVPQGWDLAALIPVGYPANVPSPPPRRSLAQLVRPSTGSNSALHLQKGPACAST